MSATDDNFDPFAGAELSHTAPLTPEQEEIWLSVQYGGDDANLAYNESIALTLTGALDRDALRAAVDMLVARHESLRCTLGGDGREICVFKTLTLDIEERDLVIMVPPSLDASLAAIRRDTVLRPFDLAWGPLVRCVLVRVAEDRHVLLLAAHHIICDGWSFGLIIDEIGQLYNAAHRGTTAELPTAPQLTAYALLRRRERAGEDGRAAMAYWRLQFASIPDPLELPLDKSRPAERSFAADRLDVSLPPDLVRRVKAMARDEGASFFALMLAAFQVFLHRVTGQPSVVVAVPAAGQSVSSNERLVGHCVRTLPIRTDVDPTVPFSRFLAQSRSQLLDAMEFAQVAYGEIVKELSVPRDPSRIPLVSVMFNVDPDVALPAFEGLTLAVETEPRAHENFELFVNARVRGDAVTLETQFNTALFDADSLTQRLAGFTAMLESIVADASQSIGALTVMTDAESSWVLTEVNRTARNQPRATLVAQFLAHAAATPDREAVRAQGSALSYSDLAGASAALAERLIDAGVTSGEHVGVCLSRSVDLLVALLGVMRAGATYVPLDPDYPPERIEFIIADAGVTWCVTESGLLGRIGAPVAPLLVDRPAQSASLVDRSELSGAAYVIFTSGSTGRPKGVVIEHRNVTNLLASFAPTVGLSAHGTLVAVTTPAFDISVLELFMPLTQGARVVIASEAEVTDALALTRLLQEADATHVQATPATYRLLIESGWTGAPTLIALVGGEALSAELAADILPHVQELWNCYGPTETTVWSTIERISGRPITIGRPIANTRVYVLDPALRPVPPGVTGELFIGGAGVARGYWNRPELSSERFLADPFVANERVYRTGDLARLRRDGRLEWIGRTDFQVKVRGYRIELGEIQTRLEECTGVREAAVIVREDRAGDQRIVAYIRVRDGAAPTEGELRDQLKRALPAYMLPQHVVTLDAFPMTPNGKVDRKSLPRPQISTSAEHRAPRTEVAQRLAEEICKLLSVTRVGLDDDFFELGGHSMVALRLRSRVRDIWSVDLPLRQIFRAPTLLAMSEFVMAVLLVRGTATAADGAEMDEFVL